MKLGIMQPYFFPYIGYYQLMNAVDEFVVYDNIEFTKKGWINRNRVLVNGSDSYISLPLKKDSDFLDIKSRRLSDNSSVENEKMLRRIKAAYQKAPFFGTTFPLLEQCLRNTEKNLFDFIYYSLCTLKEYLNIDTELIVSSSVKADHALKGERRVIDICQSQGADVYINPIGGVDLYKADAFTSHGIQLFFIKSKQGPYRQFGNSFVPNLSIIDVLMFNSYDSVQDMLVQYELIE